jgi:membrane fusion protein, multidrug efflux system
MRLKPQYVFILVVAIVVALWFVTAAVLGLGKPQTAKADTAPTGPPSVQVRLTAPTQREAQASLRGRTEAARTVILRAETAGVVVATPVPEGSVVRQGQVLCRLSVDARQASLDQARAALKSRQLQRQAAAQLAEQGFRSPTQVLEAQANLDSAQAQVRAAEIALHQVEIRAPFAGVFDRRDAEVGGYLGPGQPCGTVIELNPLLVVADAPETEAARLKIGALAHARLVSGQVLNGVVRFVARDADPQTRTYHVEVAVQNPSLALRSGLSADLKIGVGSTTAHLIPVSSLVLDSAGRQGVRYLAAGDKVAFSPVTVLDETPDGLWVSGLIGPVRVITVGQSFVADGQKVRVAEAR